MTINCGEHRSSMELLALRLRLQKGMISKEEQDQIEKRIGELEKELALD
jgi:hypothetical protein